MDRRRTLLLTAALAATWLLLGYVNVARGAAHAGAGYRFWAFGHHCYSDVIALHGDRYLGGGRPAPYLEDRIEYPVVLGVALWLASFAPGGALGHFTVTYLALAGCLAVALRALARTPGAAPWWLGATPALVYYAGLNWDLLPIALLALAVHGLAAGRAAAPGALTALGVSAKLFPAVLVPPAVAALARRPRALLLFAGALALVLVAVNGPFALLAPESWAWFFRFNAGRGAENSAWHALGVGRGPLLEALSAGPLVVASALAGFAALRVARAGEDVAPAIRLGTALALVTWIATNKIWSPQYALYGFLAGALAAAPFPLFAVLSILSVADFHAEFEVRARRWDPVFRDLAFHPVNLARTAAWLVLAAFVARALWREVRARTGRGQTGPGVPRSSSAASIRSSTSSG